MALQALYRMDLTGENPSLVIEEILKNRQYPQAIKEFARRIVSEVYLHLSEIDAKLKAKIKHWEFERLAVIDRTILRLGGCELLYFNDIPYKVCINEGIEMAKKYGDYDSSKFVNGILDALAKERHNEDSTNI